jgi:hypothetical protein
MLFDTFRRTMLCLLPETEPRDSDAGECKETFPGRNFSSPNTTCRPLGEQRLHWAARG